jgi:proline iminopeptidase
MPVALKEFEERSAALGLYATLHGDGSPILVMHGGLGLDHTYLRPWLDPLGETARLVYYDHRGSGRSATSDPWSELGPDKWSADADALCAQLGSEPVVVLGHSIGALLALEFARRHPARIRGLVLCGGAPKVDYVGDLFGAARNLASPEQFAALETMFSAAQMDDAGYRALYECVLPLYFHRPDAVYAAQIRQGVRFTAAAFLHCRDTFLLTFDSLPWLHQISVPALVLVGRHDIFTPYHQGAARLHSGLACSELQVLEESGHFPFVEEPDRFVLLVRDWLRRLAALPDSAR